MRIGDIIERVAQDDVDELIDKQRRCSAYAPPHEINICGFQCFVAEQVIAEPDQYFPVFARILVCNFHNVGGRDRTARIGNQRGVQIALGGTGVWRRDQFGPGQIYFKNIVGDDITAAFVAVEKVMSAAVPEVGHLRSRSASAARSNFSLGSSSPSASKKEKTRAGLTPSRGRSVRKLSRIAPSSYLRWTAIMLPCGTAHSDSTKATSSSAAAFAAALVGAPKWRTSCSAKSSTRLVRAVSVVWTIRTKVDQPSELTPRKPLRNAARALPSSVAGSLSQSTKAPETAHSPGSAAASNTNVSDASKRMVLKSFTIVLYISDRAKLGHPLAAGHVVGPKWFSSLPPPLPPAPVHHKATAGGS